MDFRVKLPDPITEINGEKAYPIFRFECHLLYDGCDHDYASSNKMYRELPPANILTDDMNEWLSDFMNREPIGNDKTPIIDKNPIIKHIRIILTEYETWCLKRFSHYTYLEGRSDEELLESFYRFRARKLPLHNKEEYCLMGAEDIWRIKQPCHCEHCQKLGITHIEH